jgi:phosphoketolase
MDFIQWKRTSPMYAVDTMFLAIVEANPHLRPRIGNPDEMRSNRMQKTLNALKFRATEPEASLPEDIHGSVITALNEEAVASAALANKGGINIIVTYEAFGAKMHGAMRQEIIFANHCTEAGRKQGWLSIPLVLTSHTWENSKNELSHQDPAMAEAMLGEPSNVSRVVFVPDYNTASLVLQNVYKTQGQVWTLVVPKSDSVPDLFTLEEAEELLNNGALRLNFADHNVPRQGLVLTAIGAFQLEETLKASARLKERDIPHSVVYMLEPGRFRVPRTKGERTHVVSEDIRRELYPDSASTRIFVTHTRPEPVLGILQSLHTGRSKTAGLGFIGQGGTLTLGGMLFVNRSTWGHILLEAARVLELPRERLLSSKELSVLDGKVSPEGVII